MWHYKECLFWHILENFFNFKSINTIFYYNLYYLLNHFNEYNLPNLLFFYKNVYKQDICNNISSCFWLFTGKAVRLPWWSHVVYLNWRMCNGCVTVLKETNMIIYWQLLAESALVCLWPLLDKDCLEEPNGI